MKTLKILAATAALASSVALSASLASAADMSAPIGKAPMMAPMFNWSGFYAGIHGGYASISDAAIGGGDIDGGFGGVQVGFNWQAPGSNWVFGLEADVVAADLNSSATGTIGGVAFTANADVDVFGSVRGRVGYAWGPTMVYATGGYGWANLNLGITGGGLSVSSDNHLDGYVVGGGIEHAINAGPWSVKLEYLYYNFDDQTITLGGATGTTGDLDAHTVKLGLNYRFGGGWSRW